MAKDCLEHCPDINLCKTNVRVTSGLYGFMPGLDVPVRNTASQILEEAKALSEQCPGPIPVPTKVTEGIFTRRQVETVFYRCPMRRSEI